MAKTVDLYIDQGTDFVAIMPAIVSSNNVVVDLTGYSVSGHMRRSHATTNPNNIVAFDISIPDPETGVIRLELAATDTLALVAVRWVYDIVLVTGTGDSIKVFDGIVTVNPGSGGTGSFTDYST